MNTVKTEIGYCTTEQIFVRGHDLSRDLIGKIDFIDMMMLTILARRCKPGEREMINAILVTVMDHGLTPSAMAARLTYLSAPEAPQAAIAAGLLGAGSVFLGAMENTSAVLRTLVAKASDDQRTPDSVALEYYRARRSERQVVFGLGHNIHRHGDPRVPVLREVSRSNGFHGPHWNMLEALERASQAEGGSHLPINAGGAVGAMIADMGLPVAMARGLALVARCAGLVAHVVEEQDAPVGAALWRLVLQQDERNQIGD